jgi:hypothetical protein
MRTTVTLDADVELLIRNAMERGRRSFKEVLNEAVRRALRSEAGEQSPPFVVQARPMGLRPGIDPAQLRAVDDELEVQEHLRKTKALMAAKP